MGVLTIGFKTTYAIPNILLLTNVRSLSRDGIDHDFNVPMLSTIKFVISVNSPSGKRLVILKVPQASNITKSIYVELSCSIPREAKPNSLDLWAPPNMCIKSMVHVLQWGDCHVL